MTSRLSLQNLEHVLHEDLDRPNELLVVHDAPARTQPYMRQKINGLRGCLDHDDLPPSPEAIESCLGLFAALDSEGIPFEIAKPSKVTSVGFGDLGCEWRRGDRGVAVTIHVNGDVALYRVGGGPGDPKFIPSPSGADLAEALRWFIL